MNVQNETGEDGFSAHQACAIVGITYRQLDYWARRELLTPSITEAKGSGTRRRYSYSDLVELKMIKQLIDNGLSPSKTQTALQCLRDNVHEDLARARLVLSERGTALAVSDGELVDLLAGGQGVFSVVPLDSVHEQLDAAIIQLRSGHGGQSTKEVAGG